MKRFEAMLAAANASGCTTEWEMDAWLDGQGVRDVTQRIAIKHALEAAGELGTDQDHGFRLATDTSLSYQAKEPPVSREMARWLRQSGLDLTTTYTLGQVDFALQSSGLGTLERMTVKSELYDRKRIVAAAQPTPRPGRWEMSAAVDRPRGTKLLNPDGTARTLRFS